jgi:hypothetical protein
VLAQEGEQALEQQKYSVYLLYWNNSTNNDEHLRIESRRRVSWRFSSRNTSY